jgi:hypothetical protein
LLNKTARKVIAFILASFLAGCVNAAVIDKSSGGAASPEKRKSIFERSPSDADIMREVLTSLGNTEGEPDYISAKAKLVALIQGYPQSKWVGGADGLIRTIDKLLALQLKVKVEKQVLDKAGTDKAKLVKEKEALRKDYKYLEETYQTEALRLHQENEQLRNDITALKKLEIQMDKREKMLK